MKASLFGLALWVGCGPEQTYSRLGARDISLGGADAGHPDAAAGSGGVSSTGTGGTTIGTGGTASGSGGGTGGLIGSAPGGQASGGASPTGGIGGMGAGQHGGNPATGGMTMATGGTASVGGAAAAGGRGTGGAATGGAATGGAATGGAATGGAATGGAATGGAGTGGAGTGGAGAGGTAPKRLILSIDFVGGRGTTAAPAMAGSETAGARPAAHWNSATGAMGSLGSLALSDGTMSNASVTWNALQSGAVAGLWTINYADQPGDLRMLNGYLDPTWQTIPTTATTLFTVSGLPASIASGSYDVYVYAIGDVAQDMRSYQYALGSQSQTLTQNSAPTVSPPSPFPYVSANNDMIGTHVVFTAVTGGSFSVATKPISGTNGRYRTPVNGIQIVWPSGS